MNIRIIALIVAILFTNAAEAQIIIRGRITDGTGKPVPSANVLLQSAKDSSIIKAVVADSGGHYYMDVVGVINALLRADAYGFATQVKSVTGSESSQTINFSLIADKALAGVTISSRRPVIEEKIDRTVFNVENSITAIGGDALEALKKTPGVQVMTTEINIAGKNSASIMINGRLQQLSGMDLIQLLHTIPADNLSKIEVITAPPAKYDAEGNAGIINIVTKKNLKSGLRGSAVAAYQQNKVGSPDASLLLSYRKNKLNVFCNANGGVFGWKYTSRTTTYFPPQRWEQELNQFSYNKNATIQAGADYNITPNMIIGFQYTEGFSKMHNTDTTRTNVFNENNKLDSFIYSTGSTHDNYKGKHTLNLNYEWKIDSTGRKLNVDADYYNQAMTRNREFVIKDFIGDAFSGIGSDNRLEANPTITIKSIKADVEWPTKFMTLGFGGKMAFVDNSANNVYKIYNGAEYGVDTTRSNAFSYAEQTDAIYMNGQKSVNKFDFQAGLRAEQTVTNTNSPTTGLRYRNEYTQLFPSGYVQYRMNDKNVFSINFVRRINRPGYNMLNPFRLYYNANSYVVGNPALKPSFINGLELSYRLRNKYSFKIFARQVDNYWDRLIQTDPAGLTVLTRANIGISKGAGININGQFQITKWWEMRNSINVMYSYFRLHYYDAAVTLTGMNEWFETSNSFFLNKTKTLSAEVAGYYYTPRQKDFKKWGEMTNIEFGIKAQLLNKNLIIALDMEDLLKKAYWQQTNVINNATEFSYDNSCGGRLSITYKFGNKNIKGKRDRGNASEEMQRVNQ